MSIKLTNVSGGLLVCDLAVKGKTLRLNNKQSKEVSDIEITKHIDNLVSKGLLLKEILPVTKSTKKETVKNSSKEKEE